MLRDGLARLPAAAFQQRYAELLGVLATGSLAAGDPDGAASTIDAALRHCDLGENRWCVAELVRIKGEVALSRGHIAEAEALFSESLAWARRQGALSWELKAATSLAQLRQAQGRVTEARALLSPVYGRFREGFETGDLVRARGLL